MAKSVKAPAGVRENVGGAPLNNLDSRFPPAGLRMGKNANWREGVSTCLDHTLHVVVGPRTPSHELTVRHGIDLYGVLKQAVEQQSTRP